MLLGAHVSISGSITKAPERGAGIGCSAIQVFTKNQRQWQVKELDPNDISLFQEELNKNAIQNIIAHDSYLINLGSPDENILSKSRTLFAIEMQRAEALGIPFLVLHPGAGGDDGESKGLRTIAESLRLLLNQFPDFKLTLLLETTAGQGSAIGYHFKQLAQIINLVNQSNRIGVCFDTAHAFAAGYDIRDEEHYNKTFEEFDRIIGLHRLQAFHLNDSKKPFASRVDRHENIGKGFIGLDAFRLLINDTRFQNIPKILETPGEEMDFKRNLDLLKSLIKKQG
jgi:deoxyribonuclease IV